ncbi:hypothetical protein ACEQ8H_000563 [Pleosporales sp. CAS-2024a]
MASPFSPPELAYLEAHKHDSRVREIHWVYSVPIATATISTALRFAAKRLARNGITLDDYLLLLATLCLVGECCTGLAYGPPHGMGRHVIVVSAYDQMMVRRGDYIFSHFYDFALVFVKLAILAFYWRVFVLAAFRSVVAATAALVVAWGIAITVTLLLACRPLPAYWDANVKGHCLDLVTFTYFTNISNLVTDIWIFLMPVPMIWHLQLQTKRKLLLIFIFCTGLATCVVSSIRLTIILRRGSPDFTWYYVPLGAYSVFEPLGGILCTNLPIVWPMWRKHKALNHDHHSVVPKESASTTRVNGSGSRRHRLITALGLSTVDRTQNPSAGRTVADGADATTSDFDRLESMESQKPDPNIWTTVERLDSGSAGTRRSEEEAQLKPGMKRTNWHVRR